MARANIPVAAAAETSLIEGMPPATLDNTPVGYEAAMPFLAVSPWHTGTDILKSWLPIDAL